MRRRLTTLAAGWPIVAALLLLAGDAAPAKDRPKPAAQKNGGETGQSAARVARLVDQLGSDSYAERREADDALAKIGRPTRRQLEAVLDDQDAEVRLRAQRLLARIKVSDLWAPTYVTFSKPSLTVSQAIEEIAGQTGNHVLIGEAFGAFHDRSLTLDTSPTTFWKAIDDVCRQSENHTRPHYDPRPGVALVARAAGRQPVAYSGPLRAHITTARRVFSEQLDFADLTSDTEHTFQIDLRVIWEDRFHLVAHRSGPELVEAVTDTGERLAAIKRSGRRDGWKVTGPGMRQLSASVAFGPPPLSARELDRFKLKWGMIAVGDMTTLEVTDIESKQTHYGDDLELIIEDVRRQRRGNRYVATVLISRDLVVPDPRDVLQRENRLELFDSEGRAFPALGASSAIAGRGVRLTASFRAPQPGATPERLRLTYPRIRDQRELEIEFRHVPLPVARPE